MKKSVCEECVGCRYYITNNDTETTCVGQTEPCFEYIPMKPRDSATPDDIIAWMPLPEPYKGGDTE